jgi:DNA-binding NarL/FixJ family response regulator
LALLIDQEPDLEVCGEAEDAYAAAKTLATLRPDILILDLSLNGPDGFELLKLIRGAGNDIPILVLSMYDETIYAERVLRAGANGYIMKQEATDTVLDAIRRIIRREIYVSQRVANKMLQQLVARPAAPPQPSVDQLSDRELEVFRLIGDGLGTREIATALHLSIKTVESYQAHIKEKLSLPSARALMQRAIEWRLAESPTGNPR